MKIAKEFRWEMGHRLPEHFGSCKNIHGHSYKMVVEIEGDVNPSGMVMDYYDLQSVIDPVIENLDHAFMVSKDDIQIIEFLEAAGSKKVIVDFPSTVENICRFMIRQLPAEKFPDNVKALSVSIFETHDNCAVETARFR